MEKIVTCYCPDCGKETPHELYISEHGYLHSLCTRCGKDVCSSNRVNKICTTMTMECPNEGGPTLHIKYISEYGYIHWFCCSCGKDVCSSNRVKSC